MFFFFQAEDGIRDAQASRGLGDVYKRQTPSRTEVSYSLRYPRPKRLIGWTNTLLRGHLSPAVWRGLAPSDTLALKDLSAGLTPSRTEVSYSLRHTHLTRLIDQTNTLFRGQVEIPPYGGGSLPPLAFFKT